MGKKPTPHNSSPLRSRPEPKGSLFQTSDHSQRDPVQQPFTREDKKRLRKQAREHYEQDWLAPFGSDQEKQLLRIWRKRGTLSPEDQKLIDAWLKDPEAIKRSRGPLFLYTAKEKYLGKVIWNTAAERHGRLDDTEWLVAYFTAQGKRQSRLSDPISSLTGDSA
jgi:hypothetical protein